MTRLIRQFAHGVVEAREHVTTVESVRHRMHTRGMGGDVDDYRPCAGVYHPHQSHAGTQIVRNFGLHSARPIPGGQHLDGEIGREVRKPV